jgi:hypothetical protein
MVAVKDRGEMMENTKAVPLVSAAARPGKTASQAFTNSNAESSKEQGDRNLLRRWFKAGIGLLFYRNLISFRLACKLSDFWGVKHE